VTEDRKTILIQEEITKFLAENREKIIRRALKRLKQEAKEEKRNGAKVK
jgi:hypothetical protein